MYLGVLLPLGVVFSTGASPMGSPSLSPQGSPVSMRRNHSPDPRIQGQGTSRGDPDIGPVHVCQSLHLLF